MEQQRNGNESATPSDISWMVSRYERLVQELNAIRDLFITTSPREKAMVEWASHALDVSGYYHDAVFGSITMAEDMRTAVQSAFSEASWSAQTRAMRYMVHQPCAYPKDALDSHDLTSSQRLQFWITSLDLRDPVYLAAAIVPWDPNRSLRLLDEALSINDEIMDSIRDGKEGLPLWDFRRIAICRLLLYRGNFAQMALIMERLQILSNRKSLHEGGNFSARTIPTLEAATRAGNVCAQATLGPLFAGEGQSWEVARSWAGCEKSTSKGVEKLYLSAVGGDLEACTALSHVWAQCGSDDTDAFRQVSNDQVYALFKIAVTSQNAAAVMNLGVVWRYGVSFIIADMTVAIDPF